MKFFNKAICACTLSLAICAGLFGCTISGVRGGDKNFSIEEMQRLTKTYYKEFVSNEKINDNYNKELRTNQCVIRSITRSIDGAFAGLRTEWNVDLTKNCRIDVAFIDTGTMIASNCTATLVHNQDELAYLVAHTLAHSLLEHDNVRASELLKDENARSEDYNFKKFLRTPGGYDSFTRALGLVDSEGDVNPYNAEQEKIADEMAISLMANAGFNPSAALVLWQTMNNEGSVKARAFAIMHPHTNENLVEISNLVEKAIPLYKNARNNYGRIPACQF